MRYILPLLKYLFTSDEVPTDQKNWFHPALLDKPWSVFGVTARRRGSRSQKLQYWKKFLQPPNSPFAPSNSPIIFPLLVPAPEALCADPGRSTVGAGGRLSTGGLVTQSLSSQEVMLTAPLPHHRPSHHSTMLCFLLPWLHTRAVSDPWWPLVLSGSSVTQMFPSIPAIIPASSSSIVDGFR